MPGDAEPPRVWVPYLVRLSDDRELVMDRAAGTLCGALARGHVGSRGALAELRHTLWLVQRVDVDEAFVREHALVLPERLVDAELHPHAHRWLRELSLVCVSGLKWQRLAKGERVRIFRVAIEEEGGRVLFDFESAGGGRKGRRFRAHLDALEVAREAAELRSHGDVVRRGPTMPPSALDRVLRALSADALSEEAVLAAYEAAALVEPGYGYRGATDGTPASIDELAPDIVALDHAFAQVSARAEGQREDATAIVATLERASRAGQSSVQIPIYGEAWRVVEVAVRLPLGEDAEPMAELVLSAVDRWFVARGDRYEPTIPSELMTEARRRIPGVRAPPEWAVLVVLAVLGAIAALAALLERLK